jgi:hypothetical protein
LSFICIVVFVICFLCAIGIDKIISGGIVDRPCIPAYPDNPQNEAIQATNNSNTSFNGMEILQIVPAHRSMLGIDQNVSGNISEDTYIPVSPDNN